MLTVLRLFVSLRVKTHWNLQNDSREGLHAQLYIGLLSNGSTVSKCVARKVEILKLMVSTSFCHCHRSYWTQSLCQCIVTFRLEIKVLRWFDLQCVRFTNICIIFIYFLSGVHLYTNGNNPMSYISPYTWYIIFWIFTPVWSKAFCLLVVTPGAERSLCSWV